MNIICNIVVMVCFNQTCTFGMESRTDVEGKIISKGYNKYLVDFSKEAKNKNWIGDYSKRLVNKTDCVELN